jgi:type IV secretory pathway VirB10-like protein
MTALLALVGLAAAGMLIVGLIDPRLAFCATRPRAALVWGSGAIAAVLLVGAVESARNATLVTKAPAPRPATHAATPPVAPPPAAAPAVAREQPGQPADVSARYACRDYRRTMRRALDGVLTDGQLRRELRRVERNARLAEDPAVRRGGIALLSAFTLGTAEDFRSADAEMARACAGR